ncbi:VOC family protein [Nonomuraea cavernae]|uniref:Lactoylglutathione lyase n=1 Tax=Nonomuraea cavernae TaxID=2045107 RepID=A0A917YMX7_9ACTN|nr:VOC family protein [Nonomuraea cavernae]MCA2183521.1 VOC family protein [Nonomuraea cavernae]GGO60547.1 lactoylglutathione lyase [Nonomuraea cavernae]
MSTPTLQTGHVGLNVTDLARSTAFYCQVLGLEVVGAQTDGDRRFAFLGREGTLLITLWQQSDGTFATGLPGLHHLSFQVADIDAVRRAETTLRELGAELVYDGVVPHGEGASSGGVFFTDPDGIRLEIFAPAGAGTAPAPTQGAPTCGFF